MLLSSHIEYASIHVPDILVHSDSDIPIPFSPASQKPPIQQAPSGSQSTHSRSPLAPPLPRGPGVQVVSVQSPFRSESHSPPTASHQPNVYHGTVTPSIQQQPSCLGRQVSVVAVGQELHN